MGGKIHRKKGPRATGKAQAFAQSSIECIQTGKDKREQNRKRMRVVQLQRALDRKEHELCAFPVHAPAPKPAPRRGPTPQSEWKLKGAARPAALLARIAAGELDERGDELPQPIETYNLYDQTLKAGNFSERAETREYLRIMKQLAEACCNAGMPDHGIKHYESCMQLDTDDSMRSREGLACVLVDESRGAEARELIEKFNGVQNSAVLAYCQVIIEYVSWEVLEEEGSSEEIVRAAFLKAFQLNPFIAVFITAHETFFEVVEYIEEIKEPVAGSIEEAFVYCSQNIGVWIDTVGADAWIEKELAQLPEPEASEKNVSDEMYLGMYQTAVEMHKEAVAEAEREAAENSDDDVDLDEFDDYEPDDIDGGDD